VSANQAKFRIIIADR